MTSQITKIRTRNDGHLIAPDEITMAQITRKYLHATGRRYETKEMDQILIRSGIHPFEKRRNSGKGPRRGYCRIYKNETIEKFFTSKRAERVLHDVNFRYADLDFIDIDQVKREHHDNDVDNSSQTELNFSNEIDCVTHSEPTSVTVATHDSQLHQVHCYITVSAFNSMFSSKRHSYRLDQIDKLGIPHIDIVTTRGVERAYMKSDIIRYLNTSRKYMRDMIALNTKLYKEHFANSLNVIDRMSPEERSEYDSLTEQLQKLHNKFGSKLVQTTTERLTNT